MVLSRSIADIGTKINPYEKIKYDQINFVSRDIDEQLELNHYKGY